MVIEWKGAKSFEVGRRGNKPNKIVIHWIATGTIDSATTYFNRPTATTSAHYGVEDNRIVQWCKEDSTAYHAGNFQVNLESIGIEHSATPDRLLSEQSYKTSAQLIRDICTRYNIPLDRQHIIKHSEVKATQCPGTIDLDKLINLAKGYMSLVDKYGASSEQDLDNKIMEHVGLDWGNANNQDNKSHLAEERRKSARFEADIVVMIAKIVELNKRIVELDALNSELSTKLVECENSSSTPIVNIQEETTIAGKIGVLNGWTIDSNGVVIANYRIK